MNIILIPLLGVFQNLLEIYRLMVIVYSVMLLLVSFNVVNYFNRAVFSIMNFLANLIDPVLMRIRGLIPSISGVDFSAFFLIVFLIFLEKVISRLMEVLY